MSDYDSDDFQTRRTAEEAAKKAEIEAVPDEQADTKLAELASKYTVGAPTVTGNAILGLLGDAKHRRRILDIGKEIVLIDRQVWQEIGTKQQEIAGKILNQCHSDFFEDFLKEVQEETEQLQCQLDDLLKTRLLAYESVSTGRYLTSQGPESWTPADDVWDATKNLKAQVSHFHVMLKRYDYIRTLPAGKSRRSGLDLKEDFPTLGKPKAKISSGGARAGAGGSLRPAPGDPSKARL